MKSIYRLAFALCLLAAPGAVSAQNLMRPIAPYMENMTWMEVRDRIAQGFTTVIVPSGGTEQSGPHMTLSKHNIIVRYTAGEIAKRLGYTMVAPVVPFSPAGRIDPPEGHMQFPGTISMSPEVYADMLEDIARSLKQGGFKIIALIGDHGGSQEPQAKVAAKLTSEWHNEGVVVVHVSRYYDRGNGQERWIESIGLKVPNPAAHGGFIDTSELLSLTKEAVRTDKFANRTEKDYKTTGAMGNSSKASTGHGRRLLALKVEAAVEQIQAAAARVRH